MALAAASGNKRRGKALLFLICCSLAGAIPHWVEPTRNLAPAVILAFFLGGYGLKVVLADWGNFYPNSSILSSNFLDFDSLPLVDVLVAARDEENVVKQLIHRLAAIKYPKEKISVWIIDDGSQDQTSNVITGLIKDRSNFHLLQRSRDAGGGKSGALNHALSRLTGDWAFILDADAQLQEDVLLRLVLLAEQNNWTAVQLRKSVINSNQNALTCFQSMEMAMDAVIQQGRLKSGGVVELRGNGQLVKRALLEECGGFNEATLTDDLDLSFRLLIANASIGILWDPPIQEEAVTTLSNLIKQRQRWAEGGLQRFFDYWPDLTSTKLKFRKRQDIACFFLLQYAIPIISFSDLITSFLRQSIPVYWPLSFVALSISSLAYWRGCSRTSEGPELPSPTPLRLLFAVIYLLHWFVVIPIVTIKMALFQKKLVWAKTIHQGH